MALTDAGATGIIAPAIIADSYTALDNTHAYLGVGDSSTAFVSSQTDLVAATNKLRKGMDATYPQRTTNVITYKSTFSTAQANFTWAEVGTFNASSGPTMFSRFVQAIGTKTSAQAWALTVTQTVLAA